MIVISRSTHAEENEYAVFNGTLETDQLMGFAPDRLSVRLDIPAGLQCYFCLKDPGSSGMIQLIRYRQGKSSWTGMKYFRNSVRNDLVSAEGGYPWTLILRNVSALTGIEGGKGTELSASVEIRMPCDLSAPDENGIYWLPGDLHQHSVLSDGILFPDGLFSLNRENGLAYMALTDHQIFDSGDECSDLLRLSGIEITSANGHFNCIGAGSWEGLEEPETAEGNYQGKTLSCRWLLNKARKLHDSGAMIIVNHPCFEPWQWKCGFPEGGWLDALEIICDPGHERSAQASQKALELWNGLLNDGRNIAGTGGSDFHGPDGKPGYPLTFIGCHTPAPVKAELMSAVRSGRTSAGCGYRAGLTIRPGEVGSMFRWKADVEVHETQMKDTIFPLFCELSICGKKAAESIIHSEKDTLWREAVPDSGITFDTPGGNLWARLDCRNKKGELTGFSEVIRLN